MDMLDTAYSIETPEGIDLTLRPAGPVPRILAYGIDTVIRWAVLFVISLLMSFAGKFGLGLFLIVYFVMEWFYPVYFEVMRQGMTPGKKGMGLRVVNDDGTPISWDGSLVRNLLRAVDFLPMFYFFGLIAMLSGSHFRRLGDLAAGTLVVHNTKPAEGCRQMELGSRAPGMELESEEQRALIDFSEARSRLSVQRQAELANILEPLAGCRDNKAVEELGRIANNLMGQE